MKDLTGQTFGRLTVIKRAPKHWTDNKGAQHYANNYWLCQCTCGNQKIVSTQALTTITKDKTLSCGCWRSERLSQYNSKSNTYIIHQEENYIEGFTTKNESFKIDLDDYDKVKKICWHITKGYVVDRNGIRLHRFVMGLEKNGGKVIDHINHDKTDNRKQNLRIVEQAQNVLNTRRENPYGHPGITYRRDTTTPRPYRVEWYGQRVGNFATAEEAVKAWEEYDALHRTEFHYDVTKDIRNFNE